MLKKVAIALGLVLLIAAVAAFVLWRQATALPEWTDEALEEQAQLDPDAPIEWQAESEGDPLPPEVAEAMPELPDVSSKDTPRTTPKATDPPKASSKSKRRKKKPKRYVLKGFHRRGKGAGKSAVRASRAVLEDGSLEAGLVLDLKRLEDDGGLSESDRSVYERATKAFPALKSRNVYVGIEDRPVEKDGVLQLGPHPKVRVGNLRYDLAKAAGKLGMSESDLRRDFNRELRRLGFKDPAR